MAKSMTAAVVHEFGKTLRIEEVPIPTPALVGLPPGAFAIPIFDVVLGRIPIRGSIVGGRQDLAEAIEFFAEGKVHSHYHEMKLEDINRVFSDMKAGKLDGRMVMTSFRGQAGPAGDSRKSRTERGLERIAARSAAAHH